MSCTYRPESVRLDFGAHRCPECGEVVIAGFPHPVNPFEETYAPVDSIDVHS